MAHDLDVAEPRAARPSALTESRSRPVGPVTLAARASSPASLLRLQRLAGNAAVQRVVGADEVAPAAGAAGPAAAPAAATPAAATPGGGANTLGDGTGPVSVNGPTIGLHAPMVQADGVFQATTIIADSVVASSYTPGAGNIW